MRVQQQPAFVLHRYPYSESSLLLDVFSRHHGRVMLMAKGARRLKSNWRGILHPFLPLLIGWSGKRDVQTLIAAEFNPPHAKLQGEGLYCGYYINELLMRLLHRHDPHETLFDAYRHGLEDLATAADRDIVLRRFEKKLLREIGYALVLDLESGTGEPVQAGRLYDYVPEGGPVPVTAGGTQQTVSGETLLAYHVEAAMNRREKREARYITRRVLGHLPNGRQLRSRQILQQMNLFLGDDR